MLFLQAGKYVGESISLSEHEYVEHEWNSKILKQQTHVE